MTTLATSDPIESIRETLRVARDAVGREVGDWGHIDRLNRMIDDCDRQLAPERDDQDAASTPDIDAPTKTYADRITEALDRHGATRTAPDLERSHLEADLVRIVSDALDEMPLLTSGEYVPELASLTPAQERAAIAIERAAAMLAGTSFGTLGEAVQATITIADRILTGDGQA